MKGDFSRLTFARKNHFRRVLMQQGRVEIDADGNEQIAIDDHIGATTTTDVIGQAGYPLGKLPDGTPVGGFALGLAPNGADVTISSGRMYIDGLLVENDDATATLLLQPDLPAAPTAGGASGAGASLADLGIAANNGVYLVYLDVWERLIAALDVPSIRESALGGPDTSVRTKVVWQAKLARIGDVPAENAPLPTCQSAGDPWPAASTGMLAAESVPAQAPQNCILPSASGYQLLENQLYRVEIHKPGTDGTATFKWSRENGSVVALVTGTGGQNAAPGTLTVANIRPDATLGFQPNQWVEFIDDYAELVEGHGTLHQISPGTTDPNTVVLSPPPATVDLALHPKIRRWDQSGAGLTDQGLTVTTGTPALLEGGVQIQFSAGTYQAGDYWVIPARTATTVEQGHIEWPVDSSGQPVPQPPLGIKHHYAKLGLVEAEVSVDTKKATFRGIGTATAPTDCRLPFPPLTDLPGRSECACTIVVSPGPGWEQPILRYFENAAPSGLGQGAEAVALSLPKDAEICFQVGEFPVTSPLVISGAGHIRVNGAGWGTRVLGAKGEGAPEFVMRFVNCASVAVRDLYAEATGVVTTRGAAGRNHINGVLAFSGCEEVDVEGVWLRCGSTVSTLGAACITVGTDVTPGNAASGAGSTRIRGCRLHVGEMQAGIQVTHQERAVIEDNEITVDPAVPSTTLPIRLADPGYLAIARTYLISHVALAAPTATTQPVSGTAPAAPGPVTRVAAPAVLESAVASPPPAPATPPPATPPPGVSSAPTVVRATGAPGPPSATAPIAPVAGPPPAQPGPSPAPPALAPAPSPPSSGRTTLPVSETLATDILAAPPASLLKAPVTLSVGSQTLSFATSTGLQSTWERFLANNPPKTVANRTDAIRYVKAQANQILTNPSARAGLSGFSGILHTLNQHVPLAARGIVVGGQGLGSVLVAGNDVSGVLMGISAGLSHKASPAEVTNEQRTPDHMGTVQIVGNMVACRANDVATKRARFGIFVGNANSLEIEGNHVAVTPAGIPTAPHADGIRVVGYLGAKAIVRHNHTSGFAMGIRVVPLMGNGPGQMAHAPSGLQPYLIDIRDGASLWLVADNMVEGAASPASLGPFEWSNIRGSLPPFTPRPGIDAPACVLIDNVVDIPVS